MKKKKQEETDMLKNKGLIIGIVTAAAVATGGVGVFAASGSIAKSNSIGEDAARRAAYADAGITEADVVFEKTEFEFERGRYVYDVEFRTADTEYDYTLDAGTGEIIEKDIELPAAAEKSAVTPEAAPETVPETPASEDQTSVIGLEAAKKAALRDAGLKAADVVFFEADLERGRNGLYYDLGFYIRGEAVYEYEIDACTGGIIERDREAWSAEDEAEYGEGTEQVTDPQNEAENTRYDDDDADDDDPYDDADDTDDDDPYDDADETDDDGPYDDADDAYDDDLYDDADDDGPVTVPGPTVTPDTYDEADDDLYDDAEDDDDDDDADDDDDDDADDDDDDDAEEDDD